MSWLNVLKSDSRVIFAAVSDAQRAADFLHTVQPRKTIEAAA
jgi:antirestriction protein ArdC